MREGLSAAVVTGKLASVIAVAFAAEVAESVVVLWSPEIAVAAAVGSAVAA